MAQEKSIVSHIFVKIDDKDIEPEIVSQIIEVTVDQQVHIPSMFTIRLADPEMKLLDKGPFNVATQVQISGVTEDNQSVSLIHGEITSLEPNFGKGMIAELTVRGYDVSHQLYRTRKSKTYLNVKDSDLAQQFAREVKLTPEVDSTATVYEHLYQYNQSDLGFLHHRAWRIGYECFVDEKKLYFRKPKLDKPEITLIWGDDLQTFQPRLTLSEQVDKVWVKGWDIQKKEPIVGKAEEGTLYPERTNKEADKEDGKSWSNQLGQPGEMAIVDQPVVSQAEANILATARLNELSGAFVEAEGEAFRRPDIRAGRMVKIEGLGERLSGNYLVTSATHIHTDAGLHTRFSVSGARTSMLVEQFHKPASGQKWAGVVPAIVTNSDDPDGWGRVKVKYPWLSDTEESHWARVVGAGGGPDCGLGIIPAVDDEVMVAFQYGDFDCPVVVGGIWNGQDAMPSHVVDAPEGEKPLVRSWTSRTGHRFTTYDNADNKVEIVTNGKHQVVLDDANRKIDVTTTDKHTVILDDANRKIEVATKDKHSVTLDDAKRSITIKSKGGLHVTLDDSGRKITIESNGEVEMKSGANFKITAGANLDIQASGMVTVKGATINLN